jgi:hypothetical protein
MGTIAEGTKRNKKGTKQQSNKANRTESGLSGAKYYASVNIKVKK